ncbi:MAG: dicarboxylate/amino acid:cation symporter [Chlamydiia bacterium]|nr:dicarboxylate/amino acid:cation symporter [Chlamydiia bacterium]
MKLKLWAKILIAMCLGLISGLVIGERAEFLKPVGTIFLNLISMIIVLLVFASMTVGITSIHDPKKLGRLGLKTLAYYLSTTVISILLGITAAYLFKPGLGLELTVERPLRITEPSGIGDILLSIIPSNPIASLVSGNVLQIIVFSLFLGVAINMAGERGRPLLDVIESLADVMYKVTGIVMEFSPLGVFAIMAWISGTMGSAVLFHLAKFILIYYVICLLFVATVFCGILRLIAGVSPMIFFRGMSDAIMVAFSTGSSSATLPVSMRCATENLGVSKSITSFVLPLGSTVNMNGTAIFQGMSAIFVSQAYGIQLDLYTLVALVITATLSAIGTAGIPGSGFIMLSAVLTSAGLPIEGLAILAGIDRLRDMVGTVLNILGDAVVAVAVARSEQELDMSCYASEGAMVLEGSEV